MNNDLIRIASILMISGLPISAMADAKDWGNYKSVERPQPKKPPYTTTYKGYADPYGHPFTQEIPIQPPQYQRPPHWGHPQYPNHSYPTDSYPSYPPQNGVTIIYNHQFPTQTEYHSESHGFVNGDSNSRIESSNYTLITDWRRYGLPDPQVGMHWIFQHGRYVQIPNDR